ncbi:ATP-binding protein [uncultured Clostridium sp.]|uniref:ATP-binding protein n=1 Tax=uncultured Clostridium sp. TaxID=59620 RepID=UPI0025E5C685|nr:ATP-binding protein [uncultured Clostridium sp.]
MPNLWHSLKNRKDTVIILDLRSTTYIASNLCSALGLILEKIKIKNNKIYLRNMRSYLKQILINNEFLSSIEFQKAQWSRYNFLDYKKFKVEEKEKFEGYLIEKFDEFTKENLLKFNKKDTVRAISEMFANVKMHTNSKEVVTCGYYDKDKKEMYFTISNHGITMSKTIERKIGYVFEKEIEAIEWAVKKSSSTRHNDETGGLGLYSTKEFINSINGEMWIVSGRGYWHNKENNIEKYELKSSFPGTLITFLFPLDYSNEEEYIDKEIISLDDIIGGELW